MRVSSFRLKILLAVAFVLSAISGASACACSSSTPCEATANADAVFVAQTVNTFRAARELRDWNDETKTVTRSVSVATLKIGEVFFGISSETVDLWSENTTCDYTFETGKTYLVFASRDPDGKWSTYACSHTDLLENAGEDLAYLRRTKKISGSTLKGTVRRISYDRQYLWSQRGMSKVSVFLVSAANKYRAVTNARGNFELRNLAGGQYRIYTEPATNKSSAGKWDDPPRSEWTIDIPDHGCRNLWFSAAPEGGVSGRVWSGNELVTRNYTVYLIPVDVVMNDQDRFSQGLGGDGGFQFDFVPPGRYYLGINLSADSSKYSTVPATFYPGAVSKDTAAIVEIRLDQKLSGYDIRLPDSLRLRTLEGVVLGPDGTPRANASVQFRNVQTGDRDDDSTRADRDGKFSIQGIEGQTYELGALVFGEEGVSNSTPIRVKFGPTNAPVQLIIPSPAK